MDVVFHGRFMMERDGSQDTATAPPPAPAGPIADAAVEPAESKEAQPQAGGVCLAKAELYEVDVQP